MTKKEILRKLKILDRLNDYYDHLEFMKVLEYHHKRTPSKTFTKEIGNRKRRIKNCVKYLDEHFPELYQKGGFQ